jgi:hypothetical protein
MSETFFTVIFISFCGIEITKSDNKTNVSHCCCKNEREREMKYNFRLRSGRFPETLSLLEWGWRLAGRGGVAANGVIILFDLGTAS